MSRWVAVAMRPDVVRRGVKVAAIVGTALVAINQGDTLLEGAFTAGMAWKIPMTYLVPYLVSTYGSVAAIMEQS